MTLSDNISRLDCQHEKDKKNMRGVKPDTDGNHVNL